MADSDNGNVVSGEAVAVVLPKAPKESVPGYVHPGSASMFAAAPWTRHIPIFGTAVVPFGPKCSMSLGLVTVLSKGISRNLLSTSQYAMFMKKYGVTTATYQRMTGISNLGFSIKPFTAILSDTFSFFGYTKRWYMAVSSIIGAVCAIVYGVLPFKESSAEIAGAMIFLSVFCIANVDVLTEGHYGRLIKQHPVPGADLVSWIWALMMVGKIVASAIQGPLSDAGLPTVGIFIAAGLQAVCVFFFIFNWYGEKENVVERREDYLSLLQQQAAEDAGEAALPRKEVLYENAPDCAKEAPPLITPCPDVDADAARDLVHFNELDMDDDDLSDNGQAQPPSFLVDTCLCGVFGVNKEVITRNTAVAAYGAIMTCGVVALTVLTIVGTTYQLLYGCVVISVVLTVAGFLCIPVTIMKANFYGWVQLASYLLITGATDNFYMADAECLPDGPHFTQTFYNTVGAVIGNAFGLVGVYMFSRIFSKMSYRVTLILTISAQIFASIFDIIMVKRWNLYIGIPDHAMYICGDAVIYNISYMLSFMPLNILISRLCPKGCESTMFSILASFSMLGASTSSTIGAILMETVWPISSSVPCDFHNLPWLIICGHLVTPFISVVLVFVLIPGTRICDPIDPREVEALSVVQKWLNKRKARDAASSSSAVKGEVELPAAQSISTQ